ncbi:MAG: fibronectin type III domain-containing protein, partial [Paludibacteraceae bacterium]|nr:fibronectin type III domain-containing protein [Paludibacteraceae bacterium]
MKTIVQKLGLLGKRFLLAASLAFAGVGVANAVVNDLKPYYIGTYLIRNNYWSANWGEDVGSLTVKNSRWLTDDGSGVLKVTLATPDNINASSTTDGLRWNIYKKDNKYFIENVKTGKLIASADGGYLGSLNIGAGNNSNLNKLPILTWGDSNADNCWNNNEKYFGFELSYDLSSVSSIGGGNGEVVVTTSGMKCKYSDDRVWTSGQNGENSGNQTYGAGFVATSEKNNTWGHSKWIFIRTYDEVSNGPAAPTNVSATANSASAITVSWDAVSGADSYTLYYSNDTQIASGITGTSYPVTGLTAGTAYSFYVKTVDGGDTSAASATASATTLYAGPVLTITSTTSSAVNLSWTYGGAAEAGYEVWRSTDGSSYSKLADVASGTTTYSDTSVSSATTYYYKVLAKGHAAESFTVGGMQYTDRNSTDNFRQDTQQGDGLYNAGWINDGNWAKYSVTAAYTGTYNVTAYIGANNAAFTGYLNDENNKTTPLATFTGSSTGWQNYVSVDQTISLTAGTQDIYFVAGSSLNFWKMVFSISAVAASDYSNVENATTLPNAPATPTGLTAAAASSSSISLNWTASVGATGYTVYKSTDNTNWDAGTAVGNVTSYTSTGLTANTTYYYKVAATN